MVKQQQGRKGKIVKKIKSDKMKRQKMKVEIYTQKILLLLLSG